MKLAALSIAVLFGCCALGAQTPAPAQFILHASSGCPVAMQLNQSVTHAAQQVGSGQRAYETRLHLVLSHVPHAAIFPPSIKAADVTVHGYSGRPRFALVSPGDAQDVRSLQVKFTSTGDQEVASDFAVPGLASAAWLEISSLTFAHGSVWKPANGQTCTVTPDMLRLVSQSSGSR